MEVIFGRNPVLEALASGRGIEKIVALKGAEGSIRKIEGRARDLGVKVQFAEKPAFERLAREAGAENAQGVLAYVEEYEYASVDDMLELAEKRGEAPLLVILDGIEDPHNLGAIIRSADGAGAHGVVIPKRRAASVSAAAIKASAGAAEHMLCARVSNIAQTVEMLKKRGVWIYALDMDGECYWNGGIDGAAALVVGNEGGGISRLVREKCDFALSIPMFGKVQSLNASNAAAILLYEAAKTRKFALDKAGEPIVE